MTSLLCCASGSLGGLVGRSTEVCRFASLQTQNSISTGKMGDDVAKAELLARIQTQGDLVRSLKEQKADKEKVRARQWPWTRGWSQ
jgi:hypothetical protein